MTAITLMERLETLGIRLEAIDSRLRFFPAELVSDDMRREMAVHKSEILRLLQKPRHPGCGCAQSRNACPYSG